MNFLNSTPMSRRTMLRNAGACLSLPLLESMCPRSASAQAAKNTPPRMIFCYVPNGVNEEQWMPKDAGPNWTPSSTLAALKDFKSDLTVMSGVGHPNSKGGHFGADTWLTGANLEGTPGKDYQNSISVDQVAAGLHGLHTRFPSLELSNAGGTGAAGHSNTLSFDRTGTPLPAENNAQRLFDRLFAPEPEAERAAILRRHAERRSILDELLGEAKVLNNRLGKADQQKLDEYLGSVREVEQRVQRLQNWVDVPKPQVSSNGLRLNARGDRHDRSAWLEVMLELSVLAFKTDTTRIIAFEWAREAAGWGETGEDHHELSHHGGDAGMLAKLAGIDRFHIAKLAKFLNRLKTEREGELPLLANTMVLYGSGMNNGKGGGHSPKNLPLLLAGGGNLGLKHGSHLQFPVDSIPFSNVLLTMLHAMGVQEPRFMDSTGIVKELRG